MSVHPIKHMVRDMLQGNVHVFAHFLLFTHHIKQFHGEIRGIGIVQTYPFQFLYLCQFSDQFSDSSLPIEVETIESKFLGDDKQFSHAPIHQLLCLLEDVLHGAAHMFACDDGNSAIGTMAVASLADFQIGIMPWCGYVASSVARVDDGFSKVGNELLVIEFPIVFINCGYFFLQLLTISLREASHDKEFPDSALLFGLRQFEDGIDAFLFGILYKTTCVHDHNLPLGVIAVVNTFISIFLELLHENLAVDKILGATHGDNIYLIFNHEIAWSLGV